MMKNPTLADTAAAIVSLLILTGAVWIAIYGPETQIPVHFDAAGQANRYGSRYEVAAVLAGLALLNLLVALMTGRQAASVVLDADIDRAIGREDPDRYLAHIRVLGRVGDAFADHGGRCLQHRRGDLGKVTLDRPRGGQLPPLEHALQEVLDRLHLPGVGGREVREHPSDLLERSS